MKRVLGGVVLGVTMVGSAWAQSAPPTAAFPAEAAAEPAAPSVPPPAPPAPPPAPGPSPSAARTLPSETLPPPPPPPPPSQAPPMQTAPQPGPGPAPAQPQYPASYPAAESPYYDRGSNSGPAFEAEEPEKSRHFSLTISPLHLIMPIVELTGELRVSDHVGFGIVAGYGSVKVESADPSVRDFNAGVFEIGAQGSFYPLREFKSLVIGGEIMWIHVDAEVGDITGTGAGMAVGPLIGYKLITSGGFTFFVHGGIQYMAVQAEAKDSTGASAEDEDSRLIPLLNANLGYSF